MLFLFGHLSFSVCLSRSPVFLDVFTSGIWGSLRSLHDPSFRELATKLETTVVASKASGTVNAYRRSFLRWKDFACSREEIPVFPARTERVALYLQYVLDTSSSQYAVDSAIYGIQWAHNLAGIPSPTDSPVIQAVSNAAKRLKGTRLLKKRILFHLKC